MRYILQAVGFAIAAPFVLPYRLVRGLPAGVLWGIEQLLEGADIAIRKLGRSER